MDTDFQPLTLPDGRVRIVAPQEVKSGCDYPLMHPGLQILEKMGFEIGRVLDACHREITLPFGWRVNQRDDYLSDPEGNNRVDVFMGSNLGILGGQPPAITLQTRFEVVWTELASPTWMVRVDDTARSKHSGGLTCLVALTEGEAQRPHFASFFGNMRDELKQALCLDDPLALWNEDVGEKRDYALSVLKRRFACDLAVVGISGRIIPMPR